MKGSKPKSSRNTVTFVLIGVAIVVMIFNFKSFQGSIDEGERIKELLSSNEQLSQQLSDQRNELLRIRRELDKMKTDSFKSEEIQRLKKTHSEHIEIIQAKQNGTPHPKEVRLQEKLEEYTQLHNDITSGKLPPRYLHCVLINGWGNALQEAVSCFMVALVARRAVLFNSKPLEGYMPFRDFLDASNLPFDGYNLRPLSKYKELVIPRFNFTCMNYHEDYSKVELITIHLTYDWFAPNVIVNPHHADELLSYLPPNYFQIIFRYLFRLRPDIQKDVDEFKRQHFGKFTVGIQIRHPSRTNKGEIDHDGFPVPPLELYAQAAEQLGRFQSEVPYEDVVWFVATQNVELIQRLQLAYGTRKVVSYNGTITTTFDSHQEGQRVSLITWWLLGEAQEVITTEVSSYGTTAASRSGVTPIVCTHHKYCFRRLTPTPCQDTPWLKEQPVGCLKGIQRYPHESFTSPENSCGFYKLHIYTSKEFQSKSGWNV